MKLKKTLAVLLAAIMVTGCLAACGSEKPAAQAPATEAAPAAAAAQAPTEAQAPKILRITSARDFKNAAEGKTLVFENLIKSDMAGNFSPWMAESYTVSEDGMVYTFKLRQGITYHDGTPFNAEAAKFSLDYAISTTDLKPYADCVNILDDYTVELRLKDYMATVLYTIAGNKAFMITPSDVDADGKLVGFVGTGPFVLNEDTYQKNVKAELSRFDDYWDGVTALDGLEFVCVPDPNAQVVALESDEVDVIGITEHHSSIPYVQISALREKGFTVQTDETGRYQVLEYNCTKPPFDDVNVRMAMNLAFNREEMVENLFEGMTEPANVITAPWYVDGPDNVNPDYYKYDPDRAVKLLDEAGWVDTDGDGIREKDGMKLSLTLVAPNGEANADAVAVYLQSELKKVGAEVTVKNLESSAASELRDAGEYDMYVHHSFCLPWYPGGIALDGKYHSGNKSWSHSFHDETLDGMIDTAFTNPDAASRSAQIDEIWEYLHAQAPCMPLYSVKKLVAMNPRVTGYHVGSNMFDMSMVKDMDMDMSK